MNTHRWMVTGASGQLGGHILRCLAEERIEAANVLGVVRRDDFKPRGLETVAVDLADADTLRKLVNEFRPNFILHVGAMSAVGECFEHPDLAEQVNVIATRVLAEAAADVGARVVFTSSDMVFDGQTAPYRESDTPRPVNTYGRTKVAAERELSQHDHALTVRIPLLYGLPHWLRQTTFVRQLQALREGRPLRLFTDEFRTPAWVGDVARALVGLARSAMTGVLHVAGPQRLTRYELVEALARVFGFDQPVLEPIARDSIAAPEPRPADLSLDATRFATEFPRLAPRAIADITPSEIGA